LKQKHHFINFFGTLSLVFASLLLLGISSSLSAQVKKSEVIVDRSDVGVFLQTPQGPVRKLIGNVEMSQKDAKFYCDSARMVSNTEMTATGRVVMVQDTINGFSDSLIYKGVIREAELFGDVVLVSGRQKLFTTYLHYNLNTKVARYPKGALLTDGKMQLRSKRGEYHVAKEEAYFKDEVEIAGADFALKTDTLKFLTSSNTAVFLSPTVMTKGDTRIYCEGGYYDMDKRNALFKTNAQFKKGKQEATADSMLYNAITDELTLLGNAVYKDSLREARGQRILYDQKNDITRLEGNASFLDGTQNVVADTIVYNGKTKGVKTKGKARLSKPPMILLADQLDFDDSTGLGTAYGNVEWEDTTANIKVNAQKLFLDRNQNGVIATGDERPLMRNLVSGDTLWLSADTLKSFKKLQKLDSLRSDSVRYIFAYHDVRIYKSDLQALSDSLSYNDIDSIFKFFGNPIMWSDTSQFKSDTLFMKTKDNKISELNLIRNSMILNSGDEIFFNQIKGKYIDAYFRNNQLSRMHVNGNAESVYYAQDEQKGYIGVNKSTAAEMMVYFGSNQVEKISFISTPKSVLTPMRQADHEKIKLEGFKWEKEIRPKSIEDLLKKKTVIIGDLEDLEELGAEKEKSEEKK
jgi:lipopolysaccharide export system protein LptA